jgi:hypothetical protein
MKNSVAQSDKPSASAEQLRAQFDYAVGKAASRKKEKLAKLDRDYTDKESARLGQERAAKLADNELEGVDMPVSLQDDIRRHYEEKLKQMNVPSTLTGDLASGYAAARSLIHSTHRVCICQLRKEFTAKYRAAGFGVPLDIIPPRLAPMELPVDKVRQALLRCVETCGESKAREILKLIGETDRLHELCPTKYQAVIDACKIAQLPDWLQ